jgi:hypothetical protein
MAKALVIPCSLDPSVCIIIPLLKFSLSHFIACSFVFAMLVMMGDLLHGWNFRTVIFSTIDGLMLEVFARWCRAVWGFFTCWLYAFVTSLLIGCELVCDG